ncbi:MAG: hypothetical protein JRI68_05945 [Deltaproteobacteria bacterium]|nr:hypothetical protein [Deltaproteobacteria bacterium]
MAEDDRDRTGDGLDDDDLGADEDANDDGGEPAGTPGVDVPTPADDIVTALAADDAPLSSVASPLPQRRVWPLFVVIALLVGAGAFFLWRQLTAPLPLRVLVAIDMDGYWWEGSKPAAKLADDLAERLADLGFDPVRGGDPETTAVLEDSASPAEAARKLRAAFIITGRLEPKVYELPVAGKFYEVHLDARVRVEHVNADRPLVEELVHTFAGAKTEEQAKEYVAGAVARRAFDVALPAIIGHESIQGIIDGNDPKLLDQLAPARTVLAARNKELSAVGAAYEKLAQQRAEGEQGPHKPTFVSTVDAEDRLVGIGPEGLLLTTAPVTPYYSPKDLAVYRLEGLETVEWRGQGGEAKRLWRGYNAFTNPSAAPGGGHVALVEDLYGWARSLVVVQTGGPMRRLRVEAQRKLSEPQVSPDGRAVALIDRACRSCAREIVVYDVTGDQGKELYRLGAEDYSTIGDFRWFNALRLMVLFTPAAAADDDEPPVEALWAINVRSGERTTLLVPAGGASLAWPVASDDGKVVAVSHLNGSAIVTLNVPTNAVKSHSVGGTASKLALSPDGKRVVFELRPKLSYAEIALLDIATSKVTQLTKNKTDDRSPLFSLDGGRIYYETRDSDPVFPRKRMVVRVAWVPATP